PPAVPHPGHLPVRETTNRIARPVPGTGPFLQGTPAMNATITVHSPIVRTPRVLQLEGIFDLRAEQAASLSWHVHLPLEEKPWNIGLIVGPSGCGKSTVARKLWPEETARGAAFAWPADRALIDAFPEALGIKDVAEILFTT